MIDGESELEMAERHIRLGEAAVTRQRVILKSPLVKGAARAAGEKLLVKLEVILEMHYRHRDSLLAINGAYQSDRG